MNLRRVVKNIKTESAFEVADWSEFVLCLLPANKDLDSVVKEMTEFSKNGRSFMGKTISLSKDHVFGRITELDRYTMILDELGKYNDINEIKLDFRSNIGKDPGKLSAQWKKYPLGRGTIWATFRGNPSHPFGNPRLATEEIICSLGIPKFTGTPIIFQYELPNSILPKIPAICDAYCSSSWNRYFLRVDENEEYGLTDLYRVRPYETV